LSSLASGVQANKAEFTGCKWAVAGVSATQLMDIVDGLYLVSVYKLKSIDKSTLSGDFPLILSRILAV